MHNVENPLNIQGDATRFTIIISPCRDVRVVELRLSVHKALIIETSRTSTSRICIRFSIRIRFPSGASPRLVSFVKDFTHPGRLWYPFMYPRGQRGESAENLPQWKPRRAFSDAIRIKDSMFTRTWSSETTATHNARNNRDCTSISSAHPRTLVTPTIRRKRGVLCKWHKRTRPYEKAK